MILKIDPIFVKKPWGGNNIKKTYEINTNKTSKHGKIGEILITTSDGENNNRIIGTNKFLDEFYRENREKYFNNYYKDKFPLTIKIINTSKNLPIQVNPKKSIINFLRARSEKERSEVWFPLNINEKEKFVVGVKSKNEIKEAIKNYDWKFAFEEKKLKKNIAYNVKAGTVFGIKANSLIYKILNNDSGSDKEVTIYDEKTKNEEILKGDEEFTKKILKAIKEKNIIEPFKEKQIFKNDQIVINQLAKNNSFTLEKWNIESKAKLRLDKNKKNFLVITCIEGHGIIGQTAISENENVIVTSDELNNLILKGKMTLLVSNPNNPK